MSPHTLGPLLVEPFGDKVSTPFPFVVTDVKGNIVAYCLTELTAYIIVEALDDRASMDRTPRGCNRRRR